MTKTKKHFNLISIKNTANELESAIHDVIDAIDTVSKSETICLNCKAALISAQTNLKSTGGEAVETANSIYRKTVKFGKANLFATTSCGCEGGVSIKGIGKENK